MIEWIVSSSILILAVILVRAAFRSKLRAWVRYGLWALVLARLLIPVSFGSAAFSAGSIVEEMKQRPAIQSVTQQLQKPDISYQQAYDQAVQDFLQSGQTVNPEQPLPDYTAPNYKPQTPLEQHTQQILEKNTPAVKLETALLWIWSCKCQELGRMPTKKDFDSATCAQIKAYLGPWPRALESAGLKQPKEK